MSIIYCNFNMFDMNSQVIAIGPEGDNKNLFMGSFEDVCNYIAAEYQTRNYEKVVLAGPYGTALEDRIRTYSKMNYNYNDINIEVV